METPAGIEGRPKRAKMNNLVLSIFPGIDLLGRAFEEEGYCVVRGPDPLWGGDIKSFHPPAGVFEGVIGGPPCQIFSKLRWLNPDAIGKRHGNLIPEFCRVVKEVNPGWWLMENVKGAQSPEVKGYRVEMLELDNLWFGGLAPRRRKFWFGSRQGLTLHPEQSIFQRPDAVKNVVLSGHSAVGRGGEHYKVTLTIPEMCKLQGLPDNFADEFPFTAHGKRRVIGNAVPLPMGRALAKAVKKALECQTKA